MNPVDLIAAALADGVELRLDDDGSLKASGESAAVSKWAALIRPNKASIIAALKVGTDGTAPMTASEVAAIRAWLTLIGEFDAATITEVIDQCQRDADARHYFLARARAELPKDDPDDRRRCTQCLQ